MKYNKSELEEYLNIARNRAYNSLKHFFKLLDIDYNLFAHLFNIDIKIDYDSKFINEKDGLCARYDTGTNTKNNNVYISVYYINTMLDNLYDNKISRQDLINDLAVTIVHELLHANRSVIIDNEPTIYDKKDREEYDLLLHEYNIESYKEILDECINSGFYNYFDKIVPLKAVIHGNNCFSVVCYDKEKEAFYIYKNQKFGYNGENIFTLFNIGIELNSNNFKHKIDVEIPYLKDKSFDDHIDDSADYFHQKSTVRDENKENNRIVLQTNLEENLVEMIANLIVYSRKNDKIDLDLFKEHINTHGYRESEKLSFEILYRMGIDSIRWFILSAYEDEYDDKLYNAFKEKYDSLLNYFYSLENNESKIEHMSSKKLKELKNKINEIIDESISIKK